MQSSEETSHDIWQHRDQPIIIIRGALLRVRSTRLDLGDCHSLCIARVTLAHMVVEHVRCLLCRMMSVAL